MPYLRVLNSPWSTVTTRPGNLVTGVFSRRCTAQESIDDILGDVRAEAAPAGVATATFVTKTPTGQERILEWADGGPSRTSPDSLCWMPIVHEPISVVVH